MNFSIIYTLIVCEKTLEIKFIQVELIHLNLE